MIVHFAGPHDRTGGKIGIQFQRFIHRNIMGQAGEWSTDVDAVIPRELGPAPLPVGL
jgi:hypothetical protein